MDDLVVLKQQMTRLKLTGLMENYSERLKQAINGKWSHGEFLSVLFSDEIDRRNSKQMTRRLSMSQLDPGKTFEFFDFSHNSTIPEGSIKELSKCQFLKNADNILFLGPSGVGKSHLAQAIGHEVCRTGKDVLFYRGAKMMKWVSAGHGDGTHLKRIKQLSKVPLLIIDDFGLEPLTVEQQSDLYEIICERYEKNSTIITSNRDLPEWGEVFQNPLLGSAAMDRVVHRALKFVIEGESYRAESFLKRNGSGNLTVGKK